MKFAFCIFAWRPYGGLQRDCLQVLRECQRRGHDVDLYAGEWRGEIGDDVTTIHVPSRALTNHGVNLKFARNLARLLRRRAYDAVVGFNKIPGLDVYYAGDVCYAQRVLPLSPLQRLMPRYRLLFAFERAVFAPQADTEIILLAEHQREDYVRHYHTPLRRFHVMPPDMPLDRLYRGDRQAGRAAARAELGLDEDQRVVLMVGSGFKAKGVDRAVRALAALPASLRAHTRLIVVGDDNAAPYRALAHALGVAASIEFTGGRADVQRYYLAADVLLHPAYHEMTGTVLLEAMGHGLPVLVTDACGFAVHVQRAQAGMVLAAPFVQEALDAALTRMLEADERAVWSANGLAWMRHLPLGERAPAAADVIESAARRRGAA